MHRVTSLQSAILQLWPPSPSAKPMAVLPWQVGSRFHCRAASSAKVSARPHTERYRNLTYSVLRTAHEVPSNYATSLKGPILPCYWSIPSKLFSPNMFFSDLLAAKTH